MGKVNSAAPKAIITDLNSQFYMDILILPFHNF
jgi:hypothetical protein